MGDILVDYLFVEILSAPTTDLLPEAKSSSESQSSDSSDSDSSSSDDSSTDSSTSDSSSDSVVPELVPSLLRSVSVFPVRRQSFIADAETRIIPAGLRNAHSFALNSFNRGKVSSRSLKHSDSIEDIQENLSLEEYENPDGEELLETFLRKLKAEREFILTESDVSTFDAMWG